MKRRTLPSKILPQSPMTHPHWNEALASWCWVVQGVEQGFLLEFGHKIGKLEQPRDLWVGPEGNGVGARGGN